jgi:hypothetical protein
MLKARQTGKKGDAWLVICPFKIHQDDLKQSELNYFCSNLAKFSGFLYKASK